MPYSNNYNSFGMSPIRRRNPIGMNVTAFADAITKLDAKYQQQAQQQSAIDMALAQLPVNAAEDAWRMGLRDELKAQIDSVKNPNDKLLTSIKAAGQLMNRPDVIGRIRAQADYKNFVEQTQKRNDIDQRTKNWAIETNPYDYQDILDKNGRIVGGSEWKPTNTPVANVSLASLGTLALQWAKPDEAKGSNATFVDAEGNFTNDLSKAVDVAYQTTTGYKTLGKDKLMEAINAAIDMTPGARASIEQDYKVAEWDYNKLTPEQKATIGETEFTDSNGRPLTRQEFLAKKLNPWSNAASFSNKESTITYGTGLQTAYALRQKAAAAQSELQNALAGNVNYTGTGYNITYDTSDYISSAQGNIEDAIRAIEGAMPKVVDTKLWQEAKASGNYAEMENIIRNKINIKGGKRYFDVASKEAQNIVNKALTTIYNNQSFISSTFKNLDKDTKDAILAKAAFDAGQKGPENNKYVRTFYQLLGDLSGGKAADSYRITFNDKSDVEDFLNRMGMNEATAKENGIEIGYDKKFLTATIKQNSNFLPKAIMNFFDGNDNFISAPWNRSSITALDDKGNSLGKSRRGTLLDNVGERLVGSWTNANHFNNFRQSLNSIVEEFNNTGLGTKTTNQLKIAEIPAIVDAQRKYGIESAEFNRAKENISKALAKRLSGSDWTQFQVYNYNEDTRGLTLMPNVDRGDQTSNIISHLQNGKADVQFATDGIQHGYYVTLHGKLDKNGNVDDSDKLQTYFIASGVEDEAMSEFITDSNTRATGEYNRRRSVLGTYRNYLGDNITNISNNKPSINGRETSKEEAIKYIEVDKIIDDVVNGIKGNPNLFVTQEAINSRVDLATTLIANNLKISPNSPYAIKIKNIILNKVK